MQSHADEGYDGARDVAQESSAARGGGGWSRSSPRWKWATRRFVASDESKKRPYHPAPRNGKFSDAELRSDQKKGKAYIYR
jgi:hypothetical protein